jgi:D-alanine-D-alanine ligase
MIRLAVLAGGRSPEHDISIASGNQVVQRFDRREHRLFPVYLDRDGGWRPGAEYRGGAPPFPDSSPARRPGAALDLLLDEHRIDCVFPVLHGPFGEDGTVQGMLELYGIPCVGSGCAASAVAIDKLRTRECLRAYDLPMAPAILGSAPLDRIDPAAEAARIVAAVGAPCFVKVDRSGSSIGVHRGRDAADVAAFLAGARGLGTRFYAEAQLAGTEISVPVLGNSGGPLEALPPIGIYPRRAAFFDHDAKYSPGASEEVVPPRGFDRARIEQVQQLALRCHSALWCDGMSRTDMIVTDRGPFVLEVNTLPGMTETSLLPQSARAHGIEFPALLARLVQLALARARGERR